MENQVSPRALQTAGGGFIGAYIITMRPYLLFVSGITGIAGLSFATGMSIGNNIAVSLASFLSYGFGQALTDCFQTDTDSISAPYRPLTQGIISKRAVLVASILGLALCVSVFVYFNPLNLMLGIISGTGLATYTYFKKRWWGGPFYNAWIVALLCIMAFETGSREGRLPISSALIWTISAVFFGYANFVLTGYFKDISADRATGYLTLPVVYGRKISAVVSDLFALLTVVSLAMAIKCSAADQSPFTLAASAAFGTAAVIHTVMAQIRVHKIRGDNDAYHAISPVVHGYILTLSSIACTQKPGWIVPLMLFYSGFILVLKFRPSKSQI